MNITVIGWRRGIGLKSVRQNPQAGHKVYAFIRKSLEELKPQGMSMTLPPPDWVKTGITGNTGPLDSTEPGKGLIHLIAKKGISETGSFWPINGEHLPC